MTKKIPVAVLALISWFPNIGFAESPHGVHVGVSDHDSSAASGGTMDMGYSKKFVTDHPDGQVERMNVDIAGSVGEHGFVKGKFGARFEKGTVTEALGNRDEQGKFLSITADKDMPVGNNGKFAVEYGVGSRRSAVTASGMERAQEEGYVNVEGGVMDIVGHLRPVANIAGYKELNLCGKISSDGSQLACFEVGGKLALGTQVTIGGHVGGSYRHKISDDSQKHFPSYFFVNPSASGTIAIDSFTGDSASDRQIGIKVGIAR
jgi:hypothetical protein